MLTGRHRRALSGSIAACLLLLAFADVVLAQSTAAGRIMKVRGRVEVLAAQDRTWKRAASGQILQPGDTIRTGPAGWAAVLLADETLLQLNRNTQFVLKEVALRAGWFKLRKILPVGLELPRSVYRLEKGEAWIRNKDRGVTIDIETPTVSAGIRGTEFALKVSPDDTVLLTVLEGVVRAWNVFGSLMVGAREQAITRPGTAPLKVLLISSEDAVQWTVTIPALITYHDIPLISNDRAFLRTERQTLEKLLAAQPGAIDTQLQLGRVLRDEGFAEAAVRLFRRVIEREPENPDALTFLGWTYLDLGRPEEAQEAFLRARTPGPMNYAGRSAAYTQLGLWEEAVDAIQEGQQLYPDSLLFHVQRAFLHLRLGELKEASAELKQSCEPVSGAALASGPEQVNQSLCLSLLALTTLALGDKTEALEAARKAAELSPNSSTAWIILSYTYQASFDLDQALAATKRALALDDSNVMALVNLARLYFGSDYTDKAAETIERARQLARANGPADGEVYNVLGFIRLAQLKTDEAIAAFDKARDLDPGLGEPHLGLALCYMRKGDTAPPWKRLPRPFCSSPGVRSS